MMDNENLQAPPIPWRIEQTPSVRTRAIGLDPYTNFSSHRGEDDSDGARQFESSAQTGDINSTSSDVDENESQVVIGSRNEGPSSRRAPPTESEIDNMPDSSTARKFAALRVARLRLQDQREAEDNSAPATGQAYMNHMTRQPSMPDERIRQKHDYINQYLQERKFLERQEKQYPLIKETDPEPLWFTRSNPYTTEIGALDPELYG